MENERAVTNLGTYLPSSTGAKFFLVCGLALMMAIPALMVNLLVNDRTARGADVLREVSASAGGAQTFLGPTLAIPYTYQPPSAADPAVHGVYLVSPAQGNAAVKTTTEERHRSLFRVPVFHADLRFDAEFDLSGPWAGVPVGTEMDWKDAEIVVGVSDTRGALADATLTAFGHTVTLEPSSVTACLPLNGKHDGLAVLGVPANIPPDQKGSFHVTVAMRFSGAQRLALLPYGKTTHVTETGDWKSPGFDGGTLPVRWSTTPQGYAAEWTVPFIARNVPAAGPEEAMEGLGASALGVSFVEVADPYQSVSRSLKYALLFLGLVFLTYFVFEVTTGRRVHPAQYLMVGLAQIIFYLMLGSVAERIGFGWGFLLAGAATVGLLAANVRWLFRSGVQGMRALGVFSLLYTLIYLLLRLEDNALLLGAVASFLAVAGAMYATRQIDWYRGLPRPGGQPAQTEPR